MTAGEAKTIARVLSSVVNVLEDGAQSAARVEDGSMLTYADGWSAAANLAKLAAADAMAQTISEQQTD